LILNEAELPNPGVCFICESSPTKDTLVVNTMLEWWPINPTNLDGCKLVCEQCVRAMLYAFSWPTPEDYNRVGSELVFTEGLLMESEAISKGLVTFRDAYRLLSQLDMPDEE
jgi:hypothetical protein